jgi:hypothetical protein
MDTNLMSCPTCSHSVSNAAGACAYCGSAMVEEQQQPQADDKDVGQKAQMVESPPPLPQKEIPAADIISDEGGEIPLVATEHSESYVFQQAADSPATAETSEPATEAETVSQNELISVEDEAESKPPDDEQDLKSTPESYRLNPDVENDSEIASTETVGPESVPEADVDAAAEIKQEIQEPEGQTLSAVDNVVSIDRDETQTATVTDDTQSPPEPEVADIAGDGTGESETVGETVAELFETEASQPALATSSTLEKPPPLVKSVEDPETKPVEDLQPKNEGFISIDAEAGSIPESLGSTILVEVEDEGITIDAKAGSIPESSGDTVWLEMDDEVKPGAGELPDKIEKSEKSESQAGALKVAEDAQGKAAAIEKQKASLAKAQKKNRQAAALAKAQAQKKQDAALAKEQALKKQKLVLAKEQALKKQKLVLANAAALKRKKAAHAKAQALKKQTAAQADIVAAKKNESVTAADRPKLDPDLQTNPRMQMLLAKYKGRVIGINYDNSAEIKEAQLTAANAEYFRVFVKDQNLHYSYPLKSILTVIEGKDGVDMGDGKQSNKFIAVIKIYPLVLF